MFRQGDVLIVPVEWVKGDWNRGGAKHLKRTKKEGIILAAGEATGHHHKIKDKNVRRLRREGKDIILVSRNGATVVHEEHDPITLGPGAYEVRRQREFDPPAISQPTARAWRNVAD